MSRHRLNDEIRSGRIDLGFEEWRAVKMMMWRDMNQAET